MSLTHIDIDDQGIATLTLQMEGRVNKINEAFVTAFAEAVAQLAEDESVKGIVLASGHRDFCVGADIDMLYAVRDPARMMAATRVLNGALRTLETCGKPVVAALTGTALGGGYELALACHHRIALDDSRVQVGLPEVNLGVLPGGGGTQRLPRIVGIQAALELLTMGAQVRAPKALSKGLVDALAPTREAVLAQARAWCLANPKAQQPWDASKKMRWPGVRPGSSDARNLFIGACALIYKKTAGAFPAADAIVDVVKQGSELTFDRALEVEARAFARLATSDTAKDMLRTVWYHRQAAERCVGLPQQDHGFRRVGILGAGMMGAGLAAVCASKGFDVVLKDINADVLEAAQAHCATFFAKKRHLSEDARQAMRDRITLTLDQGPLEGCDLIIEAVVENVKVKHAVLAQTEPGLADHAVWASNTSALPMAVLSEDSAHRDRFIGLHFFSPVEKMPLLEIVMGEHTSEETLGRAVSFARAIGKLPIVVNDGYGFYTTRLFSAYLLEGVQLVCQGHDPVLIEWAAREQGMAVPPLKVFDEVTLTLVNHAFAEAEVYRPLDKSLLAPAFVKRMVEEFGRKGKAAGAGFYEYDGPRRIWPELSAHAAQGRVPEETGVAYLGRRLMLAQVAEVARCWDEGILRSHRDADLGALFGLGFAPNTGGPLSWIDRQGAATVVAELRALAETHGERFVPAPALVAMAEKGERFYDAV